MLKKYLTSLALVVLLVVSVLGGAVSDRLFGYRVLDRFLPRREVDEKVVNRVLTEESVVIEVAKKLSPSVVTVNISTTQRVFDPFSFNPFNPFSLPNSQEEQIEQDIGSAFVISADGLVVTNKHVVSDSKADYKVVSKEGKTFEVEKIYRDPANDLAILKINLGGASLQAVELGDSSSLEVGQFVIAIGTALGEFPNTVTTGVISGLGRGISAGSALEGYVEKLDDVIQTDAAINPGNSGGPLINSSGQVIGVNVAVAAQAQNIGFALPINVVKEAIDNFQKTGSFNRPFLGVRYQFVDRDLALMNEVPQGAYVREVVEGSAADQAGIETGDIITKIAGQNIDSEDAVAQIINGKKVGEQIVINIWRDDGERELKATLRESE